MKYNHTLFLCVIYAAHLHHLALTVAILRKMDRFLFGTGWIQHTCPYCEHDVRALPTLQVLRGDYLVVYGAKDDGVANDMPNVASFVQQDFSGARHYAAAPALCI
jgi:hypothetical protein